LLPVAAAARRRSDGGCERPGEQTRALHHGHHDVVLGVDFLFNYFTNLCQYFQFFDLFWFFCAFFAFFDLLMHEFLLYCNIFWNFQ
jgi:hypothetical protein